MKIIYGYKPVRQFVLTTTPFIILSFCLFPTTVVALELDIGGLKTSIDSTVSLGLSRRIEEPEPALAAASKGNANFEKGDLVAAPLKGSHDIEFSRGNSGAFIRFTYLYDRVVEDKSDEEIPPEAKSRLGHDLRLLDAFLFSNFELMDRSVDVRVGNQVVSWGESTFIQNGINTINPIDVGRFLIPGSELKEALLPAPIALFSIPDLFPYVGFEFYYQSEWDETEVPPVGTFFSFTDLLGEGDGADIVIPDLKELNDTVSGFAPIPVPYTIAHGKNFYPDDGDAQFGAHLSITIPQLSYSELGLFFINYHSQTPVLSGTPVSDVVVLSPPLPSPPFPPFVPDVSTADYFWVYPDDIRLYGLSYSSQLGDTALQGEISFRPNMPFGLPSEEVVTNIASGIAFEPYDRLGVFQAQSTATRIFNHVLGTDTLTLVGELGVAWLDGDTNGFDHFDQDAWGLVALVQAVYFDVLPGISASPSFSIAWDVDGTLMSFSENEKNAKLGIEFKYVDTWSVGLAYTGYFGGDDVNNYIYEDRDNLSLDAKYSF